MQRIFLACVFTVLAVAASTSWSWDWAKTPFTQPVRCEGAFSFYSGLRTRVKLPGPFRNYALSRRVKFFEYNIRDLDESNLNEGRRQASAKMILDSNPDVMVLIEVMNQKSIASYDGLYLKDRYHEFVIEGNDPRGIDIAILFKKDLPFDIEYRSLKDLTNRKNGKPVFSRDLPVAIVRRLDVAGAPVEFILIGTHLKSQRGDDHGLPLRTEQSEASALVIETLRREFGQEVPILYAGDQQNTILKAKEFEGLRRVGLRDTLDLAPNAPPPDKRGTQFYFPDDHSPVQFNQIDGILISAPDDGRVRVVSGKVLPHMDKAGKLLPPPRSFKEREGRPSDHLPTEVVIDF